MSIAGSLLATEQPLKLSWDPARGPITIKSWKGPNDAIDAQAAVCRALRWRYTISRGPGDLSTLEAEIGGDPEGQTPGDEVTDSWEMLPNRVDKDILESDVPIINTLTATEIEAIQAAFRTPPKAGTPLTTTFPTNTANCKTVLDLLNSKVTSKGVDQPVLRHTWMVPPGVPFAPELTNVGLIYSAPSLYGLEGVPNDFLVPLASMPYGPVNREGIALSYGWLKAWPIFRRAAWNRREVHSEFQFGLWSDVLYGEPI